MVAYVTLAITHDSDVWTSEIESFRSTVTFRIIASIYNVLSVITPHSLCSVVLEFRRSLFKLYSYVVATLDLIHNHNPLLTICALVRG